MYLANRTSRYKSLKRKVDSELKEFAREEKIKCIIKGPGTSIFSKFSLSAAKLSANHMISSSQHSCNFSRESHASVESVRLDLDSDHIETPNSDFEFSNLDNCKSSQVSEDSNFVSSTGSEIENNLSSDSEISYLFSSDNEVSPSENEKPNNVTSNEVPSFKEKLIK